MRPLEGILVLDFGQFLSAPSASLRLADLGARVIKIERPATGDICRQLYVSNVVLDGESTVFHAINRNKESFAADLKDPRDAGRVRRLIRHADVVMHNFRPGIIERLGFDYESVRRLTPAVVYGEISGYGSEGLWRAKPGQDLLAQALSGLMWLSGNDGDPPVPMGLAIADILSGVHLTHGILACLVRRAVTGEGGRVQVSMLESVLDLQFEVLTTFFQDGGEPARRSAVANAHAYLAAPYGIYQTRDGWLALAMGQVPVLGRLLGCAALEAYTEPRDWFDRRDEIKRVLAEHLRTRTTAEWLAVLEPADIWCADVLDWRRLLSHEAFEVLGMIQTVRRSSGFAYRTLRCPIRIDGERLYSDRGSPAVGEHTAAIIEEFRLEGDP